MATLPPGWAADYDGQRWFFRYTATNHTQYHFPTPGDEFPDFSMVGGLSDDEELLPEERLESERQVRKRATVDGVQGKAGARRRGKNHGGSEEGGEERGEETDEEAFCFDSFGYLGPGSYEATMSARPGVEDRERGGLARRQSSVGAVSSVTSTGPGTGVGVGITPSVSEPSTKTSTSMGDEASEAAELPALPTRPAQHSSPRTEVPMLDSREIVPSPVGCIAELVSESTARCEDEINPPPVELPDTAASWLEPVPVPNLVNQYPVELPSVESSSTKGKAVPGKEWQEHRPGDVSRQRVGPTSPEDEKSTPAELRVLDENKSAWSTNWMSTSTQASPPPPPPKVTSRSDLPSRQAQGPGIPPKASYEEKVHQEILDFFLGGPEQPKPLQTGDGAQVAFSTTQHADTRHTSNSSKVQLDHFPSILRPGPRRSSQPPLSTGRLETQPSSQPPRRTPASGPSSPAANEAHSQVVQPPRPQKLPATGRPHSQSAVERRPPAQVLDEFLVMPNPDDHVRALRLPNTSTIQTTEPAATSSQPAARLDRTSQFGSVPLCDGAPATRAALPAKPRIFSMPEPSNHVRMPAAPLSVVHMPQRPAVAVKMPSEPTIAVGMPPEPSPPLHMRRTSEEARRSVYAGRRAEHSPCAHSPDDQSDVHTGTTAVAKGSDIKEMSPSTASPSIVMPDTEEAPPTLSERTRTSFSTMSQNHLGNNKFWQMLSRTGNKDKADNLGAATVTVTEEEGSQILPHVYIPPKGKKKQALEWSVGHAM